MDDLRYPIGKFEAPESYTDEIRQKFIREIDEAPARLREAVSGIEGDRWDRPYRPEGWTVRQVVHHLPDSHLNAYIRFKLGLTEDMPAVKPYDEARWAELADVKTVPPAVSLDLLESMHGRLTALLRSMSEADFQRKVLHSERGETSLDWLLALYAWHGRHHVAHITSLREREGW
ncbi:MAG: YfiT family bacillithiol transferase [Acidobacteriota bacterium]